MSDLILVTGATGRAGGSGGHVVRQLLAKGKSVRVLVHKLDERSDALKALGAEVVVGDLQNLKDVRAAMDGARSAYFVFPLLPTIVSASATFAQAAKEADLELTVNMSQLPASPNASSLASLNHWLSEQIFNWSGVPVTHIRATFFMEWILWVSPFFRNTGKVVMPWNAASRCTPIATEDLGRAIAAILIKPEIHIGKIHNLVGSQLLSFQEIAATLGRIIGKEVGYQQLDVDEFTEKTLQHSYFRDHCRETTQTLSEGFFEVRNNLIEEITGSPPSSFESFLQKHMAVWTD